MGVPITLLVVAVLAAGGLFAFLAWRDRQAISFASSVVSENSPIAELATRKIVWKVVHIDDADAPTAEDYFDRPFSPARVLREKDARRASFRGDPRGRKSRPRGHRAARRRLRQVRASLHQEPARVCSRTDRKPAARRMWLRTRSSSRARHPRESHVQLLLRGERSRLPAAMKMKVRSVAFALLLAPAILFADSINVTFDAALTNATGWSFNDKVTGTTTNLVATWNAASPIRSFTINSTGGSKGNLYIKSAVISGVPLIEAPTNLQTDDITGTRCRLTWTNPANAVSNRINISRVVNHEMAGEVLAEYDFAEFANSGGNPTNRTDDFIAQYPDFAGSSLIYIPAHTAGNIQISTDNQKGFLVHSGLSDCGGLASTQHKGICQAQTSAPRSLSVHHHLVS